MEFVTFEQVPNPVEKIKTQPMTSLNPDSKTDDGSITVSQRQVSECNTDGVVEELMALGYTRELAEKAAPKQRKRIEEKKKRM